MPISACSSGMVTSDSTSVVERPKHVVCISTCGGRTRGKHPLACSARAKPTAIIIATAAATTRKAKLKARVDDPPHQRAVRCILIPRRLQRRTRCRAAPPHRQSQPMCLRADRTQDGDVPLDPQYDAGWRTNARDRWSRPRQLMAESRRPIRCRRIRRRWQPSEGLRSGHRRRPRQSVPYAQGPS